MTGPLVLSLALAVVAGTAVALVLASWPRRLTAEEWVHHRRAAHAVRAPRPRLVFAPRVRLIPPSWLDRGAYREAAKAIDRDLQFSGLGGGRGIPSSREQ